MDLKIRFNDIAEAELLRGGITWNELFTFWHRAAMCRYCNQAHLHAIDSKLGTTGRKDKLTKLVELGYFDRSDDLVYSVTPKTIKALGELDGYCTTLLQTRHQAEEARHQLRITDVLIKFIKRLDFFYAFYPNFEELIPDACIILTDKMLGLLHIVFLEVEDEEARKDRDYLRDKWEKYYRIARTKTGNRQTYDWWEGVANLLKLPIPPEKNFSFQVCCFGKRKENWEGWVFQDI